MLIYSDSKEPFRGKPVPYDEQPAIAYWTKHYENYRYLDFIGRNSTDRDERRRAEHEIRICQNKMAYWERHVNWTADQAAIARAAVDRNWSRPPKAG